MRQNAIGTAPSVIAAASLPSVVAQIEQSRSTISTEHAVLAWLRRASGSLLSSEINSEGDLIALAATRELSVEDAAEILTVGKPVTDACGAEFVVAQAVRCLTVTKAASRDDADKDSLIAALR